MDFQRSEVYKLHELVIRLDHIARKVLEPLGVSYADFLVLLNASEHEQRRQSDIAAGMGLSKPAVSLRIKALVKKGLVIHTQNNVNRREWFVSLSDEGRSVVARAEGLLSDSADPVFSSLGAERSAFLRHLNRLLEALPTRY